MVIILRVFPNCKSKKCVINHPRFQQIYTIILSYLDAAFLLSGFFLSAGFSIDGKAELY